MLKLTCLLFFISSPDPFGGDPFKGTDPFAADNFFKQSSPGFPSGDPFSSSDPFSTTTTGPAEPDPFSSKSNTVTPDPFSSSSSSMPDADPFKSKMDAHADPDPFSSAGTGHDPFGGPEVPAVSVSVVHTTKGTVRKIKVLVLFHGMKDWLHLILN